MSPPRWPRKKSLDRTLAGKGISPPGNVGSLINARESENRCKYVPKM